MVLVYREVLCVYTHREDVYTHREENAERVRRRRLFMGFLTQAHGLVRRDRERGCSYIKDDMKGIVSRDEYVF